LANVVLATEVVIQVGLGDAQRFDDVGDGGLRVAALEEQRLGNRQDFFALLFADVVVHRAALLSDSSGLAAGGHGGLGICGQAMIYRPVDYFHCGAARLCRRMSNRTTARPVARLKNHCLG
jgi:hypothetical protein